MVLVWPLLLAAASSCAPSAAARVDDSVISPESLERQLDAFRANRPYIVRRERLGRGLIADMNGNLARGFIAEVLTNDIIALAVEAEVEERSLKITDEDREFGYDQAPIAAGNRQIFEVFPRWYQRLLEDRATRAGALRRLMIEGETHEEYYERNREDFSKACTRDLVVATRKQAIDARERILSGEDFAAVTLDVSIDEGSGPKGGDLGCNGRGDLVPELDKAAYEQRIGEVSEPIPADGRFHLVLVYERSIRPYARLVGEVELAHLASGTKKMTQAVRDHLRNADVHVSARYGTWDRQRLKVTA